MIQYIKQLLVFHDSMHKYGVFYAYSFISTTVEFASSLKLVIQTKIQQFSTSYILEVVLSSVTTTVTISSFGKFRCVSIIGHVITKFTNSQSDSFSAKGIASVEVQ